MSLATTSAPWQNGNMPALDLRRYLMTLVSGEGVRLAGDFKVSQRAAGANMSVDIAAGLALVFGDSVSFQGPYAAYNDGVVNLTGFAAADGTNPRIDRVVLEVRDAFHGGAANDWRFLILTGTPSAGANLTNLTGAQSVGSNRLLLANVLIPNGSSSITDANIDSAVRARIVTAGAMQVAATVSALGAFDGAQALLRAATTPFNPELALVYEAAKAKWVGQPTLVFSDSAEIQTAGSVGDVEKARGYLPWKDLRDAGLTWEVRLIGEGHATTQGGGSQDVDLDAGSGNKDAAVGSFTELATIAGKTNSSAQLRDTGWVLVPTSITSADVLAVRYTVDATNAGQTTFSRYNLYARAVSA